MCELVRSEGVEVTGVGALVDRSEPGVALRLPVPLSALVRVEARSWEEQTCPLYAQGEPLADPGSRRLGRL